MRSFRLPLASVLALATLLPLGLAVAGEDPTPAPTEKTDGADKPKDGDGANDVNAAKEGEQAKDERKVDAAAVASLKKWGEAMHLPAHMRAEGISSYATASNAGLFGGGELTVKTTWKRDGDLDLEVTLPAEMVENVPEQQLSMLKGLFITWAREALAPVMISPSKYAADYHIAEKKQGDETAVELLPYSETAAAELQLLYFDEDGLLTRRVMIPRVDPNDPMQQMLVGAEIESTYGYEKIGKRSVLKRMSMLTPMGELGVTYTYYEVTGGTPLLKSFSMQTPFVPDPVVVSFHDYKVDGQPVVTKERGAADASEGGDAGKTDGETKKQESDSGDEPSEE